jgi:GT2 family glycosyltransferase
MSTQLVTPRLSVVIACRNAGHVLGFQLRALFDQGCPVPWEVLVCDAGSLDSSVELAGSWTGRLPVRIVRVNNRTGGNGGSAQSGDAGSAAGLGNVLNAGAHAARGDWLAFCDPDMEVGRGWLATLCAALAGHDAVTGRFLTESPSSPRLRGGLSPGHSRWLRDPPLVTGLPEPGAGNLGVRRAAFLAASGFDPAIPFLQGTDLCWRLNRDGAVIAHTPDLVMHAWSRASSREHFDRGRSQGFWFAELVRRHTEAATAPPRFARSTTSTWPVVDWIGGSHQPPVTGDSAWRLGWQVGRLSHSGIRRRNPDAGRQPAPPAASGAGRVPPGHCSPRVRLPL